MTPFKRSPAPSLLLRAAALGLACTLAACAVPKAEPPVVAAIEMPARWDDAPGERPVAESAVPVNLPAWWQQLGDPALDALVQRALEGNLTVASAQARLRAARALQAGARAAFGPQLTFGGVPTASPDSRTGYFQLGFDARWELGLFGRDDYTQALADADGAGAEAEVQGARLSLVAEVARNYLELVAAVRLDAVRDEEAQATQQQLRLLRSRVQAQLAPAGDLGRAEARVAAAQALRMEPREQMLQARQRLRVLLGAWEAPLPSPPAAPGIEPTALPVLRVDALPSELLQRRPDIRRAEAQVLKAGAAVGLARTDLMPRLSLGALIGVVLPLTGPGAGGALRGLAALGPTFDIPLFDGGRRDAALAARRAELEAALADHRQTVLEALADAQTARDTFALQQEQVAVLARARSGLVAHGASVATRVRLQLADEFEAGEARAAIAASRVEQWRAWQAERLAYVAMCKALGGAP